MELFIQLKIVLKMEDSGMEQIVLNVKILSFGTMRERDVLNVLLDTVITVRNKIVFNVQLGSLLIVVRELVFLLHQAQVQAQAQVRVQGQLQAQVLDQHQDQDQVQVQVQVQMELQTQTQPQSQPEITVCYQDIGTSLIADANTAQQVKIMTSSKENVLSVKLEILIVAKFIHVFQTVGNLSLRSQHKLTVSYPISGETK
jgi:hypothetical protein